MSIGNKEKGYTMFARNDVDIDKQRYKHNWYEALIPFIQSTRKEYDDFFNESNPPISEDSTAASWCDGCIAQVASIVDDLEIFNKNKTIANKHSTSRTRVEQAPDTSKVFLMLKKLEVQIDVKWKKLFSRHLWNYTKNKGWIWKFYSRYSSKESKPSESRSSKGLYEGLVPFITCGFNPSY